MSAATSPAPPKHLSKSGKALWRTIVDDYRLGDEAHALEVLRLALEALDRASEARMILAADGLFYVDRFGQPRPHPAAAIERDSAVRAARMFRELSLDADALGEPRVPRPSRGWS